MLDVILLDLRAVLDLKLLQRGFSKHLRQICSTLVHILRRIRSAYALVRLLFGY